jgi:hypothetical protein
MDILEHMNAVKTAKQGMDVFKNSIDIWSQMIPLEEGERMRFQGRNLATKWFGGYNEEEFGVAFYTPCCQRIDNKKILWKEVGRVVHFRDEWLIAQREQE